MPDLSRVITSETLEARARKFAEENGVPYDICIDVGLKFYLRHGYDIVRENELLDAAVVNRRSAPEDPFASLRKLAA